MYNVNEDGFKLKFNSHGINDVSVISLKIALEAYFSTYRAAKYNFSSICDMNNMINDENKERIYNRKYYEVYSETILHFHHFIELSLKKILESVHRLFVYDVKNIISLYKVLKNDISEDEFENTQKSSAGFAETLDRIIELIDGNYLSSTDYQFIKSNKQYIKELNNLRNRLIHRGMYIFPYVSLDELIGKNILPIIMEFTKLPILNLNEHNWKYKKISCNIDPINEIIAEFANNINWDIGKIALLKELGRVSYSDNVNRIEFYEDEYRKQNELYENMALSHIAPHEMIPNLKKHNPILKCPVCGLNTLIENKEQYDEENDKGDIIGVGEYVASVNCIHCGFEILNNSQIIQNPSTYGYSNISDWFHI